MTGKKAKQKRATRAAGGSKKRAAPPAEKRRPETLLMLTHASEILTGSGVRAKDGRKVREEDLGRIEDGALVFTEHDDGSPGRVVWAGETRKLPREFRKIRADHVLDLERKQAVLPGLIDCHTHLVFAGNRADEFALRCGGATYEEIAARGGGIMSTVRATREASVAELVRLGAARLDEARLFGIRTIEIKSGYGLSFEAELKLLEAVKKLKALFPDTTIQATFLGAHAFPKEMPREKYLAELTDKMLPEIARRKLADACDVFIDQGYYTAQEGERILKKARDLGLAIKVHADELYNTESAALAARMGALSADHLLKISDAGIRALAQSETTAVLLPGTAFYLKAGHAPARKLLDAGARVAVSTDFNPGTCMTLSLPAILTTAALYLSMSRAEIFASVTYNAACALGLQGRKGTLEPARDADFTVIPFERFEEYYYRFAWTPAPVSSCGHDH